MKDKILTFLLITLIFLLPAVAQAQISTADAVPDKLFAEDKALLSEQREELMTEFNSLNGLIASHDTKCSHVADND